MLLPSSLEASPLLLPGETTLLGIFGAGGCARGIMPIARAQALAYERANPGMRMQACFVDLEPKRDELNGAPWISEATFFALPVRERFFNVAIAESRLRERLVRNCLAHGAKPMALKSHSAEVLDNNQIGEGVVLCGNTMVTSNVVIGRYFHCNIYSYVEHDCFIGDFVTFAPAVRCNGYVNIGNHAYIGAGAVLKQGVEGKPLRIGEGAIVGMGAIVTKDVPAFMTVVGNPARILRKAI